MRNIKTAIKLIQKFPTTFIIDRKEMSHLFYQEVFVDEDTYKSLLMMHKAGMVDLLTEDSLEPAASVSFDSVPETTVPETTVPETTVPETTVPEAEPKKRGRKSKAAEKVGE